ncbi:hypothetical protein AMIS_67230 [Actinoplanes missouriensis 431]|uniref:Tyr recombinase domain-containing protein n=1 Tax=Actinoplanes missouriensis (strain ATCC 14538 / DSM 43046 / CBS 188.64 / JCM 3121 / NBRC 102363 / NCIMB 12654 / NRRL B-3342 / UNCC 431) TaxID=512565 RepID=I0HG06_ACTM4|nr:tyrosine-type recombinase/integrase [Actinoplanes missouriensis]BAL91943.1 hypothetical protein AMIS_67230 [Actinoplanes missouriensis 431]
MAAKPNQYMETVPDLNNPGAKVRRQRTDALGRLGWRLRVRDPRTGGQPEQTFYGTEDEAWRELVRLEQEISARSVRPADGAKNTTVENFTTKWLEHYQYKIQPTEKFDGTTRPYSTWSNRYALCTGYIVPGLGKRRRLSSITTQDLMDLIAGLKRKDGEAVASHTRQSVANTVKAMFRDAEVMGYLSTNIAELVPSSWEATSSRRQSLQVSIRSMEGLAARLDSEWLLPRWTRDLTGPNGEGRGDILRLAAYTGLRWEEFAALDDEAVILPERVILVRATATESGGRREVRRSKDGKTAGKTRAATRSIVIVDQAVPVIERLQAIRRRGLALEPAREQRRQARGVKRPPNQPFDERWSLLLPGETGGYMSYGHFRKKLRKARDLSGIDYTVHELRHIAASILIASGASDYEIQEQMGHVSVEMTRRVYGHLFRVDRTELARRVSKKIATLSQAEFEAAVAAGNGEADENRDK